jgi:hypothetical protein
VAGLREFLDAVGVALRFSVALSVDPDGSVARFAADGLAGLPWLDADLDGERRGFCVRKTGSQPLDECNSGDGRIVVWLYTYPDLAFKSGVWIVRVEQAVRAGPTAVEVACIIQAYLATAERRID